MKYGNFSKAVINSLKMEQEMTEKTVSQVTFNVIIGVVQILWFPYF